MTTRVQPAPYRHVSRLAGGTPPTVATKAPRVTIELQLPPDWMPANTEMRALWDDAWRTLLPAAATGRELDLMWAALQAWEQQHQGTRRATTARRLRLDVVEAEANRRWKTTEDLNMPETAVRKAA